MSTLLAEAARSTPSSMCCIGPSFPRSWENRTPPSASSPLDAGRRDGRAADGRHPYASLRLRIRRAWRRVPRIASMRSLLLAKGLRMREALPCAAIHLPKPLLSETVQKLTLRLMENPHRVPYRLFGLCGRRDLRRTR